ncbi:MAG: 2Fe-2S iron-sulfur cluster binding domain-containing protein [Treponema sp.]|jgi:carbon-monoxide dehydrogenase small subunit|nr:2Fe-2S iron-sulfur cluster binding domain-containing protein [Treponema sp.]MBR4790017.1 2Fe-2S iron-sulfur cluster binding domain-containing protein [Treponema sp.]MBR5032683.1 2Fe-2S iron-sulfur cluster binding domain-containing protein [Treponema sp.]
MNVPVILNGNKTILEAPADETLMSVLRRIGCASVKCGCGQGTCGSCTVLLNDNPVATCKIPLGIIQNADIVTLEYFERTKEYSIIMKGFELAGIKLCGLCDSGKIFSAYQLVKLNKIPTRDEIYEQVRSLAPCCTDLNTLINGIILALEIRDNGIEKATRKAGRI